MAKKLTEQIKDDMMRLVDEYFFHPQSRDCNFLEDIKKVSSDKRLEAMTRIYQICSKDKQDINIEMTMFDEVAIKGKAGKKME